MKIFFDVMRRGSSQICGMLCRELERGSPQIYTAEDIAYIYDLPVEKINGACEATDIYIITPYNLIEIFENVY